MAIFLHKSFQFDITTSDYEDAEIEENIAYNCQINGVTPVLPHVRRKFICIMLCETEIYISITTLMQMENN